MQIGVQTSISWRSRLPESESRRLRRVQGKMVRSGILLLIAILSRNRVSLCL